MWGHVEELISDGLKAMSNRVPGQGRSGVQNVALAGQLNVLLPLRSMLLPWVRPFHVSRCYLETTKTLLTKGENRMEIFESLPVKAETNFMEQGKAFRAFSEFLRLAANNDSVKNSKKVGIIFYNSKC